MTATPAGTARFAAAFPAQSAAGFYRVAQGLTVSSLGIGTYLGEMNDATDRGYTASVSEALRQGVNFIDTSLNYRNQRSERAIGLSLRDAADRRDEFVVCTKAGYMVPDALPAARLSAADVVGGIHSIAPAFLADQLERSLRNLGLETIDVFYLHNPETQLGFMTEEEFALRVHRAFEALEQAVSEDKIQYYGVATWNGFRRKPGAPQGLSIDRLAEIALDAAGGDHHFRFIQLPFNLAMPEAFTQMEGPQSVLTRATGHGITVIASASLLQARLKNLPDELVSKLPGASTDAQRCIQFTRSAPGITVALVGMSSPAHVRENAAVGLQPALSLANYLTLFG